MRQFISIFIHRFARGRTGLAVIGALVVLCLIANPGGAQHGHRFPHPMTPMHPPHWGVPFHPTQHALPTIPGPLPHSTITGPSAKSTTGTFNPSTGGFVPSSAGTDILSTKKGVIPSSGTFVPSPTGSFVLKTKETFNPSTGMFSPSPTGNFVLKTQGVFVPATTGINVPSSSGPGSFVAPFHSVDPGRAAAHAYRNALMNYAYLNGFSPYGVSNPYLWSASSYYPSVYSQPYSYGSSGSYGYGTPYSYGNYGSGDSSQPYTSSSYSPSKAYTNTPAYTPKAAPAKQPSSLTAFGIPNEDGKILWPLAFRLLAPEQKQEVLEKLEAQLQIATTQAVADKANPRLLKDAQQNVDNLQQWLRRTDLAEGTYQEAAAFLRKLDKALQAMNK